jgi:hypothetical protein
MSLSIIASKAKQDTSKFNLGTLGGKYGPYPQSQKEHIANLEQMGYNVSPLQDRFAIRFTSASPTVCPAGESPP